jgi:hypothetical protein
VPHVHGTIAKDASLCVIHNVRRQEGGTDVVLPPLPAAPLGLQQRPQVLLPHIANTLARVALLRLEGVSVCRIVVNHLRKLTKCGAQVNERNALWLPVLYRAGTTRAELVESYHLVRLAQ